MRRPLIFPVGPSIAYVELTRGLYSLIDSDDAELISAYTWSAIPDATVGKFYTRSQVTEHRNGQRQRRFAMTQVLCSPERGFVVDHINANGLDNRRSNLRVVTSQQNSFNRRIARTNQVGFKGVAMVKGGRFQATIKIDNKAIYLGRFDTPEQAHTAYCEAAKKYCGEFWRAA